MQSQITVALSITAAWVFSSFRFNHKTITGGWTFWSSVSIILITSLSAANKPNDNSKHAAVMQETFKSPHQPQESLHTYCFCSLSETCAQSFPLAVEQPTFLSSQTTQSVSREYCHTPDICWQEKEICLIQPNAAFSTWNPAALSLIDYLFFSITL